MDKHQTENPAGKASHHFKVVGLLVSPDAEIFTCHEGKVDSLRQVLGDSSSRFKSFDIPSDNGVPGNNSPFYTDCAPYLGFDVPDGQPWPVRTWSRYRFSLPKGVLLWNVWSIAERELEARQRKEDETLRAQRAEAERQRQLENQRLARQKAEEERQRREQERKLTEQRAEEERHRRETLDRLWTTLRECKESREVISAEVIGFNFAGLSVKWEGLSGFVRSVHCQDLVRQAQDNLDSLVGQSFDFKVLEVDRHQGSFRLTRDVIQERTFKPVEFSVGDRVNVKGVGDGTIKEIRKNKATVILNNGLPWAVPTSELKPL